MRGSVHIRDGHDNFFTPLRLMFAIWVVIGHTFVVVGHDLSAEPNVFFGFSLSYLAVNMFFITSGFLVTKSMLSSRNTASFIAARTLRIYPALIGVMLFIMFVIGPIATSLPLLDYLTHNDLWKQPALVLSFWDTNMELPQTFQANSETLSAAPLWTLRYEMMAYIATMVLFNLGLMQKKWMILLQFCSASILWMVLHLSGVIDQSSPFLQSVLRFSISYSLGAVIFAYKDRMVFNHWGVLISFVLVLITFNTAIAEVAMNIFLAVTTFFLAYQTVSDRNKLGHIPDLSYGVYIYHWCVLQMFVHLWPNIPFAVMLAVCLVFSLVLAALSWMYIEKPMLQKKKAFAQVLNFGRSKSLSETNI